MSDAGDLTMSAKELDRLEIISRVADRRLTLQRAADQLGLGLRQVERLCRAFRTDGAAGLVSRKRGSPSNRKLSQAVRARALDLLGDRYEGFGPTPACEKLTEQHGLDLSRETLRGWMIAAGLRVPRSQRRRRVQRPRQRRWCLAASESAFDYFRSTRAYLEWHGKPVALYSDKASIFRVAASEAAKGTGITQFGRALSEFNIDIVCANTPQARGRVERAHLTLQDRLVQLSHDYCCRILLPNQPARAGTVAESPTFLFGADMYDWVSVASDLPKSGPVRTTRTPVGAIYSTNGPPLHYLLSLLTFGLYSYYFLLPASSFGVGAHLDDAVRQWSLPMRA